MFSPEVKGRLHLHFQMLKKQRVQKIIGRKYTNNSNIKIQILVASGWIEACNFFFFFLNVCIICLFCSCVYIPQWGHLQFLKLFMIQGQDRVEKMIHSVINLECLLAVCQAQGQELESQLKTESLTAGWRRSTEEGQGMEKKKHRDFSVVCQFTVSLEWVRLLFLLVYIFICFYFYFFQSHESCHVVLAGFELLG